MLLTKLKVAFRAMYAPKYLVATNTATGVIFFGLGDFGVQKFLERRKLRHIDYKRIGISCLAGGYMGLFGHYWYSFLDRRFPGFSLLSVRNKLLSEMLIGPPFAASMFLVVGTLEAKKLQRIWGEIKENFPYLILCDWGFYIPLQYFNFYYLHPRYRVLYVSILSLFYDTILVYLLHKTDIQESRELRKQKKLEKQIQAAAIAAGIVQSKSIEESDEKKNEDKVKTL